MDNFDPQLIPVVIIALMGLFAILMVGLVTYLDGLSQVENSKEEWMITFISISKGSKIVKSEKIKSEPPNIEKEAHKLAESWRQEIMASNPLNPQFIVRLEPKKSYDARNNSRIMR